HDVFGVVTLGVEEQSSMSALHDLVEEVDEQRGLADTRRTADELVDVQYVGFDAGLDLAPHSVAIPVGLGRVGRRDECSLARTERGRSPVEADFIPVKPGCAWWNTLSGSGHRVVELLER